MEEENNTIKPFPLLKYNILMEKGFILKRNKKYYIIYL